MRKVFSMSWAGGSSLRGPVSTLWRAGEALCLGRSVHGHRCGIVTWGYDSLTVAITGARGWGAGDPGSSPSSVHSFVRRWASRCSFSMKWVSGEWGLGQMFLWGLFQVQNSLGIWHCVFIPFSTFCFKVWIYHIKAIQLLINSQYLTNVTLLTLLSFVRDLYTPWTTESWLPITSCSWPSSQEPLDGGGLLSQMMDLMYNKATEGGLFPSTELAEAELGHGTGFISPQPGPFSLYHIASQHASASIFQWQAFVFSWPTDSWMSDLSQGGIHLHSFLMFSLIMHSLKLPSILNPGRALKVEFLNWDHQN